MATNISFNGVTYSIPAEGDTGWGPDLTAYFISIASNAFQKTGGAFTLTAEADFGATYGLKTVYIKSKAANPASAGFLRLGSAQSISWRNNANNADLALTTDAADNLLYNSKTVLFSGLGLIVNADVSNSAAIAYSKLNLASSIVDADVSNSAAIAYSKLAALTASRALTSNASGVITVSSVTDTELSRLSGVTSAIQTQLNAKLNASFGIVSDTLSYTDQVSDPAAPSAGFTNTYTKSAGLFYRTPSNVRQVANLDEAQTLSNKTLGNTNILTVRDDRFTLQDDADTTKQLVFQLSSLSTATTVTLNPPTYSGQMVNAGSSSIVLTGGNGYGSTNTKIRKFSANTVVGSNMTYTSSATNGDSITINKAGVYAIQYGDYRAAGATEIGISVNSSQLTTNIAVITAANRLTIVTLAAGITGTCQAVVALAVNDVIRPHDQGLCADLSPYNFFRVTEIVSY